MRVAVVIIFIALCIYAPWIARKWRWGGIAWSVVTLSFLVSAVLMLQ
jgi:hypothetical protein